MSSSITFIGSGFTLESVLALTPGVIRVQYTVSPKQTDPSAANDALNPSNYSLAGNTVSPTVIEVLQVSGDSQSVDLILSSQLTPGFWTLTVASTLESYASTLIVPPTSLQFEVVDYINVSKINPGSTNDNCVDILRKHLNPALAGPGWDALIAGLAAGDCINFDNAKKSFNQMFKSSASGKYLDQITANDGLTRPLNIGISDDVYRDLAIKITTGKVTEESILEILEIFYGEDATRAHCISDGFELFNLVNGDDLDIVVDGVLSAKVVFNTNEFQLISRATALEVAAAITRILSLHGSDAFAVAFEDPIDGNTKVKIYSPSLGLRGSVQVTGGKAQNVLQFQTSINIYSGSV